MRIGWSTVDTTPARPTFLHGQFHARISTHANDPLTVTALALESEGGGAQEQALLVSCDIVGIPRAIQQRVREAAAGRLPGFDPRKLFLNATHTHSAPVLEEGLYLAPPETPILTPTEYAEFFVQKAAAAAVRAWESRVPGGVSSAFAHAVVGHNRRAVYAGGQARMYGKTNDPEFDSFEGYEDHGVDLLFLWNEKKEPTGVIVNLACPSQLDENSMYISASFWHETRKELRRRIAPDLFVLPQCAAAGDLSPHHLLYKALEAEMRKRQGRTEREEVAVRLASAVTEALPAGAADVQRNPIFRHLVRDLELPARLVTEEESRAAAAELERLETQKGADYKEDSRNFVMCNRARRVLSRFEEQKQNGHHGMELHALRLGDTALVTNPFELFLDFGLRIKARSPALQTFVVQLACDYSGYLPTGKAVRGKGYGAEIASNRVGPDGGQALVNRTLEALQSLWPAS